jgi:hypothetical protein
VPIINPMDRFVKIMNAGSPLFVKSKLERNSSYIGVLVYC